jgi:hypothetical protein
MEIQRTVFIMGATDAGKSNYIFRFWLQLQQQKSRLGLERLPEEVAMIRLGAESLLAGNFAPHTSHEVYDRFKLPLAYYSDSAETAQEMGELPVWKGVLVSPDRAGEQWESIFRTRQWPDDWEELLSSECGCLIFVRVGSTAHVEPLDWIKCEKLFGTPYSPLEVETSESTPPGKGGFSVPTEVLMVDWLQCLRAAYNDLVGAESRLRVGIVVSAWDKVPSDRLEDGPWQYLRLEFPMLTQFLETNSLSFDWATFGVSILGGDLEDDLEFRAKFEELEVHDCGYVMTDKQGRIERHDDVAHPVLWALRLVE